MCQTKVLKQSSIYCTNHIWKGFDHGRGFHPTLKRWTGRKDERELTQSKARGSARCPKRLLALRSALAILGKKKNPNNNMFSVWECWHNSNRFFWCFGHLWTGTKRHFIRGTGKYHLRNTDVVKDKTHIMIAEVTRNVNREYSVSCSVMLHFYSIQLTSGNSYNFPFWQLGEWHSQKSIFQGSRGRGKLVMKMII